MESISYVIQYYDEKWCYWYHAHDLDHAMKIIDEFKPTDETPFIIRAVRIQTIQEVLAVAGTARD